MNAPSTTESTALAVAARQQFDLSPQTFEQALEFSKYLADSDLVPKDFQKKPGNCLIAIQWGAELGLKPMQAMQNLAIINGRPSLWGDALLALVRGSPLCEYVIETDDGKVATCKVKRRGEPVEQVRTFSVEDAQKAGLATKAGPWMQYPKRMRQLRARAFALRDVFADVLRGIPMAEELMDAPAEKHMGPAEIVGATATGPSAATPQQFYPQDLFEKNLAQWTGVVKTGRKTHDALITFIESKGVPLTEEQKKQLRELPGPDAAAEGASSGRTVQAVTDAEVKHTFATVADSLNKAATYDALAVAGDLIQHVADEQHRKELQAIFNRREAELKA
jgi:hypothetical protein